MHTEGNNATYLKRSVSNVIIRWDKSFSCSQFRITSEKGKPISHKPQMATAGPAFSQIVVQNSSKEIIKIEMPQDFLLDQLNKLRVKGHLLPDDAVYHP